MPDLQDGQSVEIKGSAAKPYVLKNVGGVYSCSCPAWRNQSLAIERRTCKHLRQFRGEAAEKARLGQVSPRLPAKPATRTKATPPALLLAETWTPETWTPETDVSGWWLSEKLDGVRAFWTGQIFQSRQGNRFCAPAWFTAGLPRMPLDGELWLARKAFQRTVSIVRRQDESALWQDLKFRVFDAPQAAGPFEERIEILCDCFSQLRLDYASVLPQMRCHGAEHLQQELDHIEARGGEGLMLRQPGSRYEAGRSATLLKCKRFRDAEAHVMGHQPGAGRHKGRLGALLVVLPDGTEFAVGTGFTDVERESPPTIASAITFRYQECTDRGVPRFPSFVRVRQDTQQPAA